MTFTFLLSIISLIAAGVAVWGVFTLRRRLQAALGGGSDEATLEQTLADQLKRLKATEKHLGKLDEAYRRLAATSSLASQKISIVRFNPFADTGGDQSFVLAVLDAMDSGYVLTSIHGRGGTRVYVKPIDNGKSKYPLSQEEQQALSQAAKRVPQ